MMMTLRIWTDGVDTVIAEDAEDAVRVFEEHVGHKRDEDDPPFAPRDMDALLTIQEDRDISTTKTGHEWVKSDGRSFLCSTEW